MIRKIIQFPFGVVLLFMLITALIIVMFADWLIGPPLTPEEKWEFERGLL